MLKKKKMENNKDITENTETTTEETNQLNDQEQQPMEEGVLQDETPVASAEQLFKEELQLANDKYLRLYAEFDNFRRRTIKEREEARKMEGKGVIVSLLPVLDDFERAVKSMETATDINSVKEGVILVQNKLSNILAQKGVKAMQSIGKAFDPDLHEAITNVPAPTDDMKGKVIDDMEKGYYLNDNVIRFAKVIVGA